jgi:uncharacterized protein YmfQ (DUF2313 family)
VTSRSLAAIRAEQRELWPPGWVWPRATDDALLDVALEPLARGLADLEAAVADLLAQIDPRAASTLLVDFERVLGPDPCGRDVAALPLAARRQIAHQRWTGRGGQSRGYFEAIAGSRGVTIRIEENILSRVDAWRVDEPLVEEREQLAWIVHLAPTTETFFRVDDAETGDRLYEIILADIECDIRRAAPAHTEVFFYYGS